MHNTKLIIQFVANLDSISYLSARITPTFPVGKPFIITKITKILIGIKALEVYSTASDPNKPLINGILKSLN